ncbi:unnamed protein product [Caenorhabditis brenneri]
MGPDTNIIFVVDSSARMHVKLSKNETAMERVFKFLETFTKKADRQTAYFHRVQIYVGNEQIDLKEGEALECLKKARKTFFEPSTQDDQITDWKNRLENDKEGESQYFFLSSVVEKSIVKTFRQYKKIMLFMDFGGKQMKMGKTMCKQVQVIKKKNVEKSARLIHQQFLRPYLTIVNMGFKIKTEFVTTSVYGSENVDISSIDIFGSTTYEPIATNEILARGFIMPVDIDYDKKDKKVNSQAGYQVIKAILGDEEDEEEVEGEKEEENLRHPTESQIPASGDKSDDPQPMEEESEKVAPEEAKQDVNDESNKKEESSDDDSILLIRKKPTRGRAKKYVSMEEEDDRDDEEYTPGKKTGGKKASKSPAKRGKRKLLKEEGEDESAVAKKPPVKNTRRGRPPKQPKVEEPVAQSEPVKTEPEEVKQEEEEKKEDEVNKEDEVKKEEEEKPKEPPIPMWLFGRGVDRVSGECMPVILRLRGLEQTDKTFYDEEGLKKRQELDEKRKLEDEEEERQKAEAEAQKRAEKEAEEREKAKRRPPVSQRRLAQRCHERRREEFLKTHVTPPKATPPSKPTLPSRSTAPPKPTVPLKVTVPPVAAVVDDSPASPDADCPASPDMSPVTSQPVKIIPREIPTSSGDVDYRSSQNTSASAPKTGDIDYRQVGPKIIPSEPVSETPKEVKRARESGEVIEPGELVTSDEEDDDELGELVDEVIGSDDEEDDGEIHELVDECGGDDADVPEEPEDLLIVQQEPVKTIPVESCIVDEDEKEKKDEIKEEEAEQPVEKMEVDEDNVEEDSIVEKEVEKGAESKNEETDKKEGEEKKEENVEKKEEEEKFIEVIVLNMKWEDFIYQCAMVGDEEAIEEITERENTVVGEEPFTDYSQLTGWFTDEAMSFYINKMFRALRKLHERSHMFDNEYRNMADMIAFGQNPDLARAFAELMVDDMEAFPESAAPYAEGASQYFEKMYYQLAPEKFRKPAVNPRYQQQYQYQQYDQYGNQGYQQRQYYRGNYSGYRGQRGNQRRWYGQHQGRQQGYRQYPEEQQAHRGYNNYQGQHQAEQYYQEQYQAEAPAHHSSSQDYYDQQPVQQEYQEQPAQQESQEQPVQEESQGYQEYQGYQGYQEQQRYQRQQVYSERQGYQKQRGYHSHRGYQGQNYYRGQQNFQRPYEEQGQQGESAAAREQVPPREQAPAREQHQPVEPYSQQQAASSSSYPSTSSSYPSTSSSKEQRQLKDQGEHSRDYNRDASKDSRNPRIQRKIEESRDPRLSREQGHQRDQSYQRAQADQRDQSHPRDQGYHRDYQRDPTRQRDQVPQKELGPSQRDLSHQRPHGQRDGQARRHDTPPRSHHTSPRHHTPTRQHASPARQHHTSNKHYGSHQTHRY